MLRTRWLSLLLVMSVAGCTGSTAKPIPAPGPSEKAKSESELAFTNLSKTAYVKLDIQTQKVAVEEVRERLVLTGWIMAKPGHEVTLTAPTAGYVYFRKTQQAPIAGETVTTGQELLELEPVLTPVERIQVAALKRSIEAELVKAQTTLKNADVEFKRAVELQKIRSKQEYEQAKKALDFAQEELAAAKDKLALFETQKITLKAPQAGTILQLHAGPGQYVPASAPLVTIIDLQPIWIRVPVPEFELPLVDPKDHVKITWKNPLNGGADKPVFFDARPTGRIAQVDPAKHTADLWYELEATKEANRFVKDQMVSVRVPIGKTEKAVVVPYSAVVFDAHGHAWDYLELKEKDNKHQFERRPVELVTSVDDKVILRTRIADGDHVVTKGAAILFSRDFHKTPVNFPEEDD